MSETQSLNHAPAWLRSGTVVENLDAVPLLARGHHPKADVLAHLSALLPGQIFLLITPFVPGPLIELGRAQSLEVWTRQTAADHFETYFGRPA